MIHYGIQIGDILFKEVKDISAFTHIESAPIGFPRKEEKAIIEISEIRESFLDISDFEAVFWADKIKQYFGYYVDLEGAEFKLWRGWGELDTQWEYLGQGYIYTPSGGAKITNTIRLGFRLLPKQLAKSIEKYKITRKLYPDVSDIYIGRPVSVIFGRLKKHDCIPLQTEYSGTLFGDITASETQFAILYPYPEKIIGKFIIEDEVIEITDYAEQTTADGLTYYLVTATRGIDNTEAKSHKSGERITYLYDEYLYLIGYVGAGGSIELKNVYADDYPIAWGTGTDTELYIDENNIAYIKRTKYPKFSILSRDISRKIISGIEPTTGEGFSNNYIDGYGNFAINRDNPNQQFKINTEGLDEIKGKPVKVIGEFLISHNFIKTATGFATLDDVNKVIVKRNGANIKEIKDIFTQADIEESRLAVEQEAHQHQYDISTDLASGQNLTPRINYYSAFDWGYSASESQWYAYTHIRWGESDSDTDINSDNMIAIINAGFETRRKGITLTLYFSQDNRMSGTKDQYIGYSKKITVAEDFQIKAKIGTNTYDFQIIEKNLARGIIKAYFDEQANGVSLENAELYIGYKPYGELWVGSNIYNKAYFLYTEFHLNALSIIPDITDNTYQTNASVISLSVFQNSVNPKSCSVVLFDETEQFTIEDIKNAVIEFEFQFNNTTEGARLKINVNNFRTIVNYREESEYRAKGVKVDAIIKDSDGVEIRTFQQVLKYLLAVGGAYSYNKTEIISDGFADEERHPLYETKLAGAVSGSIWEVVKEIAKNSGYEVAYTGDRLLFLPIVEKHLKVSEISEDKRIKRLADSYCTLRKGDIEEIINKLTVKGYSGEYTKEDLPSQEKYGVREGVLNLPFVDDEDMQYITEAYLSNLAYPKYYVEIESNGKYEVGDIAKAFIDFYKSDAIFRIYRREIKGAKGSYLGRLMSKLLLIYSAPIIKYPNLSSFGSFGDWIIERNQDTIYIRYQNTIVAKIRDKEMYILGKLHEYLEDGFTQASGNSAIIERDGRLEFYLSGKKHDGSNFYICQAYFKPTGDLFINSKDIEIDPITKEERNVYTIYERRKNYRQYYAGQSGFYYDGYHSILGINEYGDFILEYFIRSIVPKSGFVRIEGWNTYIREKIIEGRVE